MHVRQQEAECMCGSKKLSQQAHGWAGRAPGRRPAAAGAAGARAPEAPPSAAAGALTGGGADKTGARRAATASAGAMLPCNAYLIMLLCKPAASLPCPHLHCPHISCIPQVSRQTPRQSSVMQILAEQRQGALMCAQSLRAGGPIGKHPRALSLLPECPAMRCSRGAGGLRLQCQTRRCAMAAERGQSAPSAQRYIHDCTWVHTGLLHAIEGTLVVCVKSERCHGTLGRSGRRKV